MTNWIFQIVSPVMWLTGGGDEVEETFFGEKRVFQPSEVELEDACHRVDVMICLIVH